MPRGPCASAVGRCWNPQFAAAMDDPAAGTAKPLRNDGIHCFAQLIILSAGPGASSPAETRDTKFPTLVHHIHDQPARAPRYFRICQAAQKLIFGSGPAWRSPPPED